MSSSCTYYVPKCGSTRLCDQNCGVQPADRQTDRHTAHVRRPDKCLKTEGPKILSNDIFHFRTVIIGDPIFDTGNKKTFSGTERNQFHKK